MVDRNIKHRLSKIKARNKAAKLKANRVAKNKAAKAVQNKTTKAAKLRADRAAKNKVKNKAARATRIFRANKADEAARAVELPDGPIAVQFTSTECIRPNLNNASYQTFYENLLDVDWANSKLYLNIDPLPRGEDPMPVVNVAKRYFGSVKHHITKKPNATTALQWCWRQPTDDYFFHLQADWGLREPISIKKLIKLLIGNKFIAVNLRAYSKKKTELCLSPSLVRTSEAKRIANLLRLDWNAERQLRPKKRGISYANGRHLQGKMLSIHYPSTRKIIYDMGRGWLNAHNYQRNAGVNFTTWADKK